MKNPSIQLSLAGDRRLICLTAATAKIAYRQFTRVNPGYVRQIARSFDTNDSLLYKLWSSSDLDTLNRKEIKTIESEINRQVIDSNLFLLENECQLFDRYTNLIDICKDSVPSSYIFRYGLKFAVKPLTKSNLLSIKSLDLFWQDLDLNFHYVRYCGLLSSYRQQQLQLLFRYPLDLLKSSIYPVSEFLPRQLLAIQAISPCKGFRLKKY